MATLKAKRNRRPLSVRNQCQPQLVLVTGSAFNATPSPRLQVEFDYDLFGVPLVDQFTVLDQDNIPAPPDSVAFGETESTLVFHWSSLDAGTEYRLIVAPWTSGLRTPTGGYLAPVSVPFAMPE